MSNEVYAFALKSTLDEIQKACPGVTSSFIFKDGQFIAKDQNTQEEDIIQTINAFDVITERADTLGGVENITIQSAKGKVAIATTNDFYLTKVSSKEADEKYINTLTRILIPIVIRLSERIQPASADSEAITIDQPEPEEDDAAKATEEAINTAEEVLDKTTDEEIDEKLEERVQSHSLPGNREFNFKT